MIGGSVAWRLPQSHFQSSSVSSDVTSSLKLVERICYHAQFQTSAVLSPGMSWPLGRDTRLRLRKSRAWPRSNGRNLLDKIPALKFTAHCWKYKYCLFCAQRHCVLLLNLVPCRPRLFKRWIAPSTGLKSIQWISQLVSLILIHWIVIYPVDSAIQRLNVPGPGLFRVNISHFLFRTTRTTQRL